MSAIEMELKKHKHVDQQMKQYSDLLADTTRENQFVIVLYDQCWYIAQAAREKITGKDEPQRA